MKAGCMNDDVEIYVASFIDQDYLGTHTVYGYYLHQVHGSSDGKNGGYFEFGDEGVKADAMELLVLNVKGKGLFSRP